MTIGLSSGDIPEPLELEKVDKSDAGFFNNRGNYIGQIYESPSHNCRVYVTFRTEEKHYMRKHNSYAVDKNVIDDLRVQWPNVEKVAIFVADQGKILIFDLDTYENALQDNFGFGPQYFPEQTEAHTVYEKAFDLDKNDWYPDSINIG